MQNISSSGAGEVSKKFTKCCCDTITHSMTKTVNESMKQAAYPSELSKAKILPMHKEASELK